MNTLTQKAYIAPEYLPVRDLYELHGKEIFAIAFAACMDSVKATRIVIDVFGALRREKEQGTFRGDPREWLQSYARTLGDMVRDDAHEDAPLPPEYVPVNETLQRLTVQQREVVALHFGLNYDASTIATLLSMQAQHVHDVIVHSKQILMMHQAPTVIPQ